MFEHCNNFTISGGTFHTHSQSTVAHRSHGDSAVERRSPLPFHSIRLGDLNLLTEIGMEDVVEYRDVRRRRTGALIRRQQFTVGTRRIYQAQVLGNPRSLTAVIYQGTDFEKVDPTYLS